VKLNNTERSELEAKIPELKAAYKATMTRFLSLPPDDMENRRRAFREMHSSGIAFFNAIDRSIVLGSLDGSVDNSTWFTDKAETCANVLETIVLHYRTVHQEGPKVGIPPESLSPSTTAYANMQRLVAQHDFQLETRLRASFVSEGLPVYGFDNEESKREGTNIVAGGEKWFAAISGLVFLIALSGIALFLPRPEEFQFFVFRVILALAGAAFAAMISGFLVVEGTILRTVVRAGGGLGACRKTVCIFRGVTV